MSAPLVLTVTRQFDAAPEAVFDAWLDPRGVGAWLFATPGGVMEHIALTPRVGGGFEVFERRGDQVAMHFGTFVEIDRPRRLAFDFRTERDGQATRVTLEFEARAGDCFLVLTHELDPQWAAYEERTRVGWTGILEGLAHALTR